MGVREPIRSQHFCEHRLIRLRFFVKLCQFLEKLALLSLLFGVGMKTKNIVGPQVRRIRWERKWTQEKLAIELQKAGWEKISRSGVAKIECGLVFVRDFQQLFLATALVVEVGELYPKILPPETVHSVVTARIRVRH